MEENITNPDTATEPTAPEAETKPTPEADDKPAPTLDDVLKDPAMQAEFDRRVAKGITTAKSKWEKEQNMTAEQLAQQKQQERAAELDRREAELNQRAMRATALETLRQKGLPKDLADALDYADDKRLSASIDRVEKAFRDSVDAAVSERMKGNPPKNPTGGGDTEAALRAAMGLK